MVPQYGPLIGEPFKGRDHIYVNYYLAALRRVAKNRLLAALLRNPINPKKAKDVKLPVKHHKDYLVAQQPYDHAGTLVWVGYFRREP